VLDLALSLPPELAFDETFQGDAITRAFPEHADIPFEPLSYRSGPPQRWHDSRVAMDLARHAFRHRASELIDTRFAIPRLLRAAGAGSMGYVAWWQPLLVLTLLQLEEALATIGVSSQAPVSEPGQFRLASSSQQLGHGRAGPLGGGRFPPRETGTLPD